MSAPNGKLAANRPVGIDGLAPPVADRPEPPPPSLWKRTLTIMFVAQLMTAVGFSSINPFLPLYVQELGSSSGLGVEILVALVFSAQAFTMMFASPIWGNLADRYGRKLMVVRAMLGGAVLLLLMAFVRSAEQLVALRAVQGLVTGTITATNALVASDAPRERVGYAMGMLGVGSGLGVALGPLVGGAVADLLGYREAFYVTAVMLFCAGLLVLGGVHEEHMRDMDPSHSGPTAVARWKHALTEAGMLVIYLVRFLTQLGQMMIVPILPLFLATLLLDTSRLNTVTGVVTGVSAAATILSAIYLGRLGDRIGHRTVLVSCTLIAAALYWPMSGVLDSTQLLVLYALVGAALGGVVPSIPALVARYSRPGEEGTVYGLENSIRSGARFLAPLIGVWIALQFGLPMTFVATALCFGLAGILAVAGLARHPGRLSYT